MRVLRPRHSKAFAIVLVVSLALLSGCSTSHKPTTPSTSTSTSTTTSTTTTTTPSARSATEALGTNNPAQGDCTTNTTESATSVGSVVLTVTPSSFSAKIQLQKGTPTTTYGVLMQQVPGSCPQTRANGGTMTTDSTGRGHASTAVPRVPGATTFFVQLVAVGSTAPSYTSNRISIDS